MAKLIGDGIAVRFGDRAVIQQLSLAVEAGTILSIIGPNGSGKSTLLKALSRNIQPLAGVVLLDGEDIRCLTGKQLARRLAILHQTAAAPADLTVRDLVEYGRFPFRKWWKGGGTVADKDIVDWALAQTGMEPVADRAINTLSGGERQRAWIAMALAQRPEVLLLDEPTTHLDISHQLEILDLVAKLNQEQQITILMVLHDINYASYYSDTVAVLARGKLSAVGRPGEVVTPSMLREVFKVEADVWLNADGCPVCMARRLGALPSTVGMPEGKNG